MSHKVMYVMIPGEKLPEKPTRAQIEEQLDGMLGVYSEGNPRCKDEKIDWYVIGGRWAGAIWQKKEAGVPYPAESQGRDILDAYDVICNDGETGPYIYDGVEYCSSDAARIRDILWDGLYKLLGQYTYVLMQSILNREGRFSPDDFDDMIVTENQVLHGNSVEAVKGETLQERDRRMGLTFERTRGLPDPDVFIDRRGKWNDFENCYSTQEVMSRIIRGENAMEAAEEYFKKSFKWFLDGAREDDYLVIVDAHAFP